MANNINKIAKSLKKSIKTEKGTKAYDTAATVTRIEGKTAWVHIPGGVDETPVKLTMNAKKGETVQVRVSGGKAWLTGNASAPPTDDTTANKAQTTATEAKYAADNATAEAVRAKDAADRAEASATAAQESATRAETSATNAHTAATNAQESADSALVSLATVEDVVGVLNWITAHGTMTANGSAALDPTKVYFVRDNNGDYTVGSYNYSIVSEPKAEDRTSYYTLSVDESVQNYVATHVTVNSEGMWLIPDQNGTPTSNGKKILIATGAGSTYTTAGTYIIDRSSGTDKVVASFKSSGSTIYENGNIAAEFGATTRIGRNRSYGCLEVNSYSVSAYESNEEKYRLDYDFDMAGAFLRATDDLTLYSSFPTNPTVYIGTSTRNNDLVVRGNVNIASGAKYKINGTALAASDVSAVALSDKYTRSSVGTLDWTNTTDGDAKVIAKSALAFWNGAYSGTSSNLAYCNKGAFGTLATKNSLSASDVGAVPTSRTVNSKALSSNITLSASDVGAFPKSNMTRGISMVSTIPSDGKLTLNNTDIGGSSSAKIQGVLAIPQYSNGVTVKHNYDASSTSQVVLNFYKADGSAYSGAMRYFLITFPNTWTP